MKSILRLVGLSIILCLVSCTANQARMGHPLSPINQCKKSCVQQFQQCVPHCSDNCTNCSRNASNTAAKNYTKYVCEQHIEGLNVMRQLNSYRDPLQCRKVSCNCYADLSVCTQGCTGVIQKRLRPVPYCI